MAILSAILPKIDITVVISLLVLLGKPLEGIIRFALSASRLSLHPVPGRKLLTPISRVPISQPEISAGCQQRKEAKKLADS